MYAGLQTPYRPVLPQKPGSPPHHLSYTILSAPNPHQNRTSYQCDTVTAWINGPSTHDRTNAPGTRLRSAGAKPGMGLDQPVSFATDGACWILASSMPWGMYPVVGVGPSVESRFTQGYISNLANWSYSSLLCHRGLSVLNHSQGATTWLPNGYAVVFSLCARSTHAVVADRTDES
jgi:hypothetical protein